MTGRVSVFVDNLYEILENEENVDAIEWNSNGQAIIIRDQDKFKNLLKSHFKHSNVSTFIRQLNMYGFKRNFFDQTKQYYHPWFRKGNKYLIEVSRQKSIAPPPVQQITVLDTVDESNRELYTKVMDIRKHQIQLQKELSKQAIIHLQLTNVITHFSRQIIDCSNLFKWTFDVFHHLLSGMIPEKLDYVNSILEVFHDKQETQPISPIPFYQDGRKIE